MKLSLVIPYRNREEHLGIFLKEFPKKVNINDYKILIVEQSINKSFNRAKLLNIGFDYHKDLSDYFCFHDVDMIPVNVDYSYSDNPIHMATNCSQFGYKLPYNGYYGGVNIFNKLSFIKINGYSNDFWGWGGEDDDMLRRVNKVGYPLLRRNGRFESLNHDRKVDKIEYVNNLNKLKINYDYQKEGLNTLNYKVLGVEKISDNVEKISVEI